MKTTYTTKILYTQDSHIFGEYTKHNVSPYGTKWAITIKKEGRFKKRIGKPRLVENNWIVDEDKCYETDMFLSELI